MPRLLLVLLAVASVVSTSAPANAEDDPWWGEDKALHFSFSAVIAAGGYGVAVPFTEERWHRALFGGGLAIAAGGAKEAYDATGAGNPSYRDFTWDVVGAATGVGLALLLDWALSSKNGHSPAPAEGSSATGLSFVRPSPTGLSFVRPSATGLSFVRPSPTGLSFARPSPTADRPCQTTHDAARRWLVAE